ncbi:uncharacterized protein [Nothobranchius furzeri]|uniref:uncharacterized protein n=1 Tax=Nothobranchius furzeri TaxID=105023 RepID=UPI003904AE92
MVHVGEVSLYYLDPGEHTSKVEFSPFYDNISFALSPATVDHVTFDGPTMVRVGVVNRVLRELSADSGLRFQPVSYSWSYADSVVIFTACLILCLSWGLSFFLFCHFSARLTFPGDSVRNVGGRLARAIAPVLEAPAAQVPPPELASPAPPPAPPAPSARTLKAIGSGNFWSGRSANLPTNYLPSSIGLHKPRKPSLDQNYTREDTSPSVPGVDWVLLKVTKRKWTEPRWTGPYRVTERTSHAVRLDGKGDTWYH